MSLRSRRAVLVVVVALAGLAGGLALTARHQAMPMSLPAVDPRATAEVRGAAAFVGADFGGLSLDALDSHALPSRLVAAALVQDARARDPGLPADPGTLNDVLRGLGFLIEPEIANLPREIAGPEEVMPLGMTWGDLALVGGVRLRVANLGCAACHASVTYGADGAPDPGRAWLGMPKTSINLEAYTLASSPPCAAPSPRLTN